MYDARPQTAPRPGAAPCRRERRSFSMAIKEYAAKLIEQDATLKEIAEQKETLWVNPKFLPFEMTDAVCQLVVSDADIADAEARLECLQIGRAHV